MGWSKEAIKKMDAKFDEFVEKIQKGLLNWKVRDGKMKFDDDLKEEEYWELCFNNEYHKDIHVDDKDPCLVANIHAYMYYVTGRKMLGSDKYPDTFHYVKLLQGKVCHHN